jgi:hypothetical protein
MILGTTIGSSSGNPWWLYLDSAFMEAHPAYQVVIVVFFLLALPLNIALSSAASATATLLAVPPGRLSSLVERPDAAESHKKAADAEDLVALAAQRRQNQMEGTSSTDGGEEASSSSSSSRKAQGGTSAAQTGSGAHNSSSLNGTSQHNGKGDGRAGASQSESKSDSASSSKDASSGEGQEGEGSKPGLVQRVKLALYRIKSTVPLAAGMWQRVWFTDLAFNAQAMPLQVSGSGQPMIGETRFLSHSMMPCIVLDKLSDTFMHGILSSALLCRRCHSWWSLCCGQCHACWPYSWQYQWLFLKVCGWMGVVPGPLMQ